MRVIRIRHSNASRSVMPETHSKAGMGGKGKTIGNPSRTWVTDSGSGKPKKYRKKNNLSPSLDTSVTYPPARCVRACVHVRGVGGFA